MYRIQCIVYVYICIVYIALYTITLYIDGRLIAIAVAFALRSLSDDVVVKVARNLLSNFRPTSPKLPIFVYLAPPSDVIFEHFFLNFSAVRGLMNLYWWG